MPRSSRSITFGWVSKKRVDASIAASSIANTWTPYSAPSCVMFSATSFSVRARLYTRTLSSIPLNWGRSVRAGPLRSRPFVSYPLTADSRLAASRPLIHRLIVCPSKVAAT